MQRKATEKPGIVTDGLVLWLDGLDKGSVLNHWIDKVSSKDFTIYDSDIFEDSIYFKGTNTSYAAANAPIGNYTYEGATLELVFKTRMFGVLFTQNARSSDHCFSVGPYGDNLVWANISRPVYKLPINYKKNVTVSIQADKAYANLSKMGKGGTDKWDTAHIPSKTVRLGNRNLNLPFSGHLYAVRYYNRQLTEAEILQNQQYDIDTYFGGVIPE